MASREGREGRLDLAALFGNAGPVEVDLGCGKGLFLALEAAARPEANFIGVDRMSRKIHRALRRVRSRKLENVRIFRSDAFHFVDCWLPPGSVSAFHIYFPDPWPKRRHERRRYLDASFVTSLGRALCDGGRVWVATDHRDYFDRILDLFKDDSAFRPADRPKPLVKGVTDFEQEFLEEGKAIHRAGFVKVRASAFHTIGPG